MAARESIAARAEAGKNNHRVAKAGEQIAVERVTGGRVIRGDREPEFSRQKRAWPSNRSRPPQEAERLSKLGKGGRGTDGACQEPAGRRRRERVKESSTEPIEQERTAEAAAQGPRSRPPARVAARQVGALKASELSDRLARERDLAQAIARAERELGQALEHQGAVKRVDAVQATWPAVSASWPTKTAALADVLEQAQSGGQSSKIASWPRRLPGPRHASPPGEIEKSMRAERRRDRGRQDRASGSRCRQPPPGGSRRWRRTSNRPAGPRPAPSSSGCWPPRKRPPNLQERLRTVRQTSQQAGAERALDRSRGPAQNASRGEGRSERPPSAQGGNASRAGCGLDPEPGGQEGEASYFVPPIVYTESLAAAIACASGKDPGDDPRKLSGRTQRAGAAAIQEARRRLLPGALPGPALMVWSHPHRHPFLRSACTWPPGLSGPGVSARHGSESAKQGACSRCGLPPLGMLVLILLNPTRVQETRQTGPQPGAVFLLDRSRSMSLEAPESRAQAAAQT